MVVIIGEIGQWDTDCTDANDFFLILYVKIKLN